MENRRPFKYEKAKILSAPVTINLELTSSCNLKCRHCYNFWREDSTVPADRITRERFEQFIEKIVEANVYHVVLSGGEPLVNFKVLEYGLRRLSELNISTSVNSNLMLTTPEKMKQLADAGLDHILTSFNSHDPETNDYMVHQMGAWGKIVEGIKETIDAGIRVSANMIISEPNEDHVYDTAKFLAGLGVQKLFATRLVPAVTVENPKETDFHLNHEGALKAIDAMLRAKKDFGIGIGTLISYPLCLLGDLKKYSDFVGRGCPAQRGNRMVVNANGDSHACTHEEVPYGNIFKEDIKSVFGRMKDWHDGSYLFEQCRDCRYINVCGSGCRAAADSYYKNMNGKDPLFQGFENIIEDFEIVIDDALYEAVDKGEDFIVPDRVRFRDEGDFFTINVRWANAYVIETEIARFIMAMKENGGRINLSNMIGENPRAELTQLIYKEALVPYSLFLRDEFEQGLKAGCGIDPSHLA